jgi:uncharacterized protein
MEMTIFQVAKGFLNKAQAWLEEREAENSLMLGIAIRLQKYPERIKTPPFLGIVKQAGFLTIAAVMTPPYSLVLAGQPDEEALQVLTEGLLEQGWSLPGVTARKQTSRAFAEVWTNATGMSSTTGLRTRLYRLDQVISPGQVPGSFRGAHAEDIEIIAAWIAAFQEEALGITAEQEETRRQAELMVGDGQIFLWDNEGPVSMAASTRPTRNGISVNAVYTPPELRHNGYASACVAALSQHQLDSGYQFCCLFTDLENPTSNHIYMDIGYRLVCDFEEQRFLSEEMKQDYERAGG